MGQSPCTARYLFELVQIDSRVSRGRTILQPSACIMESGTDRRGGTNHNAIRGYQTSKRTTEGSGSGGSSTSQGQITGLKKQKKKHAYTAMQRIVPPTREELGKGDNSERAMTVENFTEVRAFEINAMQNAMRNAMLSGNKRVFQTMPRHLRRRAASHQPKRLPVSVRTRALREMENPSIAIGIGKHEHRRKRRRPAAIIKEYERRQEKKRWLETHIWHAKRMKMTDQWGYRLAVTPNDKGQRAAYRAGAHMTMMHDASYTGCLELEGPQSLLRKILDGVCTSSMAGPSSARFIAGSRQCTCTIHEFNTYPQRVIAPVMVVWQPVEDTPTDAVIRRVWLWIHPAAFDQVEQLFIKLKSESVDRSSTLPQLESLIIRDLRSELLVFDFIGPRTHHYLSKVLDVCQDDQTSTSTATTLWRTLTSLRTTQSLPPGVIIGLTVNDPRLRFPYQSTLTEGEIDDTSLSTVLVQWPEHVATSTIWNVETRQMLVDTMLPEKNLHQRRSMKLVPGQPLTPTPSDARIPILLVHRGGSQSSTPSTQIGRELVNGWRIILPKGWGNAFWKSFVFAGIRVGGLQEQHTMHLEAGLPCFPYDYPGTLAYQQWSQEEAATAREHYEKRPPAKRPNYTKFLVEHPFDPPFSTLTTNAVTSATNVTNQQVPFCFMLPRTTMKQWLTKAPTMRSSHGNKDTHNELDTNTETNMNQLDSLYHDISTIPLARVQLHMLTRGVVHRNAIIYGFDVATLVQQLPNTTAGSSINWHKLSASLDIDGERFCTTYQDRVLGYVTTGQLVFSQGKGSAIGSCSAHRLLSHWIQLRKQQSNMIVVLVREPHSFTCRLAQLELID
ncbi:ribonucleases P/MRP protein subunit POP1-domain-containing protein [Syncephalis plumigaleata]|nr:ribonucleases P/MRP protein subunit POP1-domain-containing protein [Syncephalis plumigaleata]